MDWKQFVASIIENTAWPIVVTIMFFLVKDEIGKLIEKIGHLKYKDLELDFDKLKKQSDALETKPKEIGQKISGKETDSLFSSLEEQILDTVESSPSAAILLSWSTVETALASAVSRLSISPEAPSYRSPLHNIEQLEKQGHLSDVQVKLLHELRILRNKITHEYSSRVSITENQALEYAHLSIEMTSFLNDIKRKRKVSFLPKGEWTKIPEGYEEFEQKESNFWIYDYIRIPGTNLTAGLGPWKNSDDKEDNFECYAIDIEKDTANGNKVITQKIFDLKHVSDEALTKSAKDLISYDQQNKVVTFDLGNSIFKYQIN